VTPTFFYHSFPRTDKTSIEDGLKVLRSMLQLGLLLVPEVTRLRAADGSVLHRFLQTRMCFTELSPDQLSGHAERFGVFALEYDHIALRRLGAVPVFYIPSDVDGKGLGGAGTVLAIRLEALQCLLGRLIGEKQEGDEAKTAYMDALVKDLPCLCLEELYYTTEAVRNLFYPTEDLAYNTELYYYRQREWKIIPNFARNHVWECRKPTDDEKGVLIELNPFFNKELEGFGKARIEDCMLFPQLEGVNTVALAQRIIVPHEAVPAAENLTMEMGVRVPIQSLESISGERT
jgi:hypothetical protein